MDNNAEIKCWQCLERVNLKFHLVYTPDKSHWEGICPCGAKNYIYQPDWDKKEASQDILKSREGRQPMAKGEFEKQYLIFQTYTLEYLSQVTGYSKSSICQVAAGELAPSEDFIRVCCFALQESKDDLFRLIEPSKFVTGNNLHPGSNQELLDTIDALAHRLTDAEAAIKALQDKLKQYS